MNHLLDMTGAVASAERENSDLSDVHEVQTLHEPSADMTSAVASADRGEHVSDVRECKATDSLILKGRIHPISINLHYWEY
jgi:hypothetical protein